MKNYYSPEFVPWGTPGEWHEVCFSINHPLKLHRYQLGKALALAKTLRIQLVSIFSLIDDLCRVSCPWCPDPCCLKANVWFDFKDILFLSLNNGPIPSRQLKVSSGDICRYSGPKGCTLPRIARPWICTWYLCPTQTAVLHKKSRLIRNIFSEAVQNIKICRRQMEIEFIKVIV